MKSFLSAAALALIAAASLKAQFGPIDLGDYLNVNDDPSSVEKAIERYLNQCGIRASIATGNNGAIHFAQVGFSGTKGLPNVQYFINALPPIANGNESKSQLIGITFYTHFRPTQPVESVSAAMNDANKIGNCAWFVDGGEIRCRSWLQIPDRSRPLPAETVRGKIILVNGDWLRLVAKITGEQ
jgi:hypothetical protein